MFNEKLRVRGFGRRFLKKNLGCGDLGLENGSTGTVLVLKMDSLGAMAGFWVNSDTRAGNEFQGIVLAMKMDSLGAKAG